MEKNVKHEMEIAQRQHL